MSRITINLLCDVPHDSQLSIISTYMNVEVFHIVFRAIPPVLRLICDIVCVRYNGRFAILRAGGAIKVKAVQPHASAVEHLPSVLFVDRLCCVGDVKVQSCRYTEDVKITLTR